MKKNMLKMSGIILAFMFTVTGIVPSVYPITAEAAGTISYSKAKKIVARKVPKATFGKLELDTDDGIRVYDATLYKGNKKYEIELKASTGSIISYEWEKAGTSQLKQNRKNIGKSRAIKIAKKKVPKGRVTSNILSWDDGIAYYKVKIIKGKKTYTLEVDAKTGTILQYKWKNHSLLKKSSSAGTYISTSAAKKIALKKVPGATVVKIEFDHDDGLPVYEIELIKNYIEYDITIHAVTGKILEFDAD